MKVFPRFTITVYCLSLLYYGGIAHSQENPKDQVSYKGETYPLYPRTLQVKPQLPSPWTAEGGSEALLGLTQRGEYVLIPVTVEDGPLLLSYGREKVGKGRQREVDGRDFPTLAQTGLHSEKELDGTQTITGKPVGEITEIGRPGKTSAAGFMARDEDIASVLKGDNRLVRRLGLTHPALAKPLFHVWNMVLREYALGRLGRLRDDITDFFYHGRRISIETHPTRGFQESIFNDEIKGAFEIHLWRDLDPKEKEFLRKKYSQLSAEQMTELVEKLTHLHTSEMEPYYVMRYGFYEGHTRFRVDPIAIAFLFGFKSLDDIERSVKAKLYLVLTSHYTEETVSGRHESLTCHARQRSLFPPL